MADDPVAVIERALVQIRRSQTRRALGPPMLEALAEQLGMESDFGTLAVVDVIDDPPAEGSDVTVGLVAERLGLDASRASRLITGAVKAGLVRREASQEDGRRSHLTLTELGQRVLEIEQDVRRSHVAARLDGWSAGDRRTFADLFARFVD
jgi:DNA-binding MarR family transcriptional regulator